MGNASKQRNVAILVFDNVEPLDFAGPLEVFISGSNRGKDFYVYTVAEENRPVTALGNLRINPNHTFADCPHPDVLIVPGGWGTRTIMHNERVTGWIREVSADAELVLSVCTGALVLAKAGLLDGMRLTTNRRAMHELREVAPDTAVIDEEARFTDNGNVILSAGVSAGIDASLYALGKLLGKERAREAAGLMEYDWRDDEIA